MRKTLSLLCGLLCLGMFSKAEQIVTGPEAEEILHGAELVRFVDRSSAPAFIRFRTGMEAPMVDAEGWVRKALGMTEDDGWIQSNSEKDLMGYTHRRFLQTYKGLPVEGAMYLLHAYLGNLVSLGGEFYPDLNLDVNPATNEALALQAALNHVQANLYQWQQPGAEAFLQMETGNPMATFYPQGELMIAPASGLDHRLPLPRGGRRDRQNPPGRGQLSRRQPEYQHLPYQSYHSGG